MKMRRDEAIETEHFCFFLSQSAGPMKMRRDEAIETVLGVGLAVLGMVCPMKMRRDESIET